MEAVNWTVDMESCLFYAMMDHKPVGENKHFNMIFIYEKYNNLCEKKLTSEQIWEHLGSLYDLQALNDTEMVPFPNEETEFTLPDNDFETLKKNASNQKFDKPKAESNKKTTVRSKNKDDSEEGSNEAEADSETKANSNEQNVPASENNGNKKEPSTPVINETKTLSPLTPAPPAPTTQPSNNLDNSKNTTINNDNEDSSSSEATETLNNSKAEPRKRGNAGRGAANKKTTSKSTPTTTKKRRA